METDSFETRYKSKQPVSGGDFEYSPEENQIWSQLYAGQMAVVEGRGCDSFLQGLRELNLPSQHIPDLKDIGEVMRGKTGWGVEPVPCLITYEEFFELLSRKIFPVTSFIRNREDFEYLREPDIFHELFGHCPMLLNQDLADFTEAFGKIAVRADDEQKKFLGRLYWYTIEFGLINTSRGLKIYGGGILSSPAETLRALESNECERVPFDLMTMLRTHYEIDRIQPIYFCIEDFNDLLKIVRDNILGRIEEAKILGMFEPVHLGG